MKKSRILVALTFILSLTLNCYTQERVSDTEVNNILLRLENNAKQTSTLKCSFIQTKQISSLGIGIESKGRFLYKKQVKSILWQYTEPNKFAIVIANGEFHLKNQNLEGNKVTKQNNLFSELNTIMTSSLEGDILSNSDFTNSFFEDDKNYIIEFSPKKSSTLYGTLDKLNLIFAKSDLQLNSVELIESIGDITSIVFDNMLVNAGIDNSSFYY